MSSKRLQSRKKLRNNKTQKSRKSVQKSRKSVKKMKNSMRIGMKKGGNLIPNSIARIGYSITGNGQSFLDGWNGKSSSFSYVNPSPENQLPINGIYQAKHGVL